MSIYDNEENGENVGPSQIENNAIVAEGEEVIFDNSDAAPEEEIVRNLIKSPYFLIKIIKLKEREVVRFGQNPHFP